jgi:transcriptional regulator with XRE-family HTH domain
MHALDSLMRNGGRSNNMGDTGERSGDGLAAWLRARIDARGLSQRQLALYAGISASTVSRILRGEVAPRADIVVLLAEYFGEDPLEALAQNGLSALDAAPAEARGQAVDLLRRLYALKPADRAFILRQLNEILDFLERDPSASAESAGARGVAPRERPPRRAARRRDARARR